MDHGRAQPGICLEVNFTTEHGYRSIYTTITTYHADMTFGMTNFLIRTTLRLESGVWHMGGGKTGKLLEHWLCHSSSLYKFGIVNDRQVFSIAVGLNNEGFYLTTSDLVSKIF